MCFFLYAGTTHSIPRKEWNMESSDISVRSVQGNEEPIKVHFSKPEVQNIGSTSNCGCDFPSAMYQGGGWPEIEYVEKDEAPQKCEQFNRAGLVRLLSSVDEDYLELYGVWAGDYTESPAAHENIILRAILDRSWILDSASKSAAFIGSSFEVGSSLLSTEEHHLRAFLRSEPAQPLPDTSFLV